METFASSAATAADPSQALLDQASFTETFHSSPAIPTATGERFRNPAGQFAPRKLNRSELHALSTEPRPAVEPRDVPVFEGEEPVEPLAEREGPVAAGEYVRVKKKDGIALRYPARTTAQNRGGGAIEAILITTTLSNPSTTTL